MNRRNSRSLRVENFLYQYDLKQNRWVPKNKSTSEDLFNAGVFYTCKKMAQKVNPVGFRLKLTQYWNTLWHSTNKNYSYFLFEDLMLRVYFFNILNSLGFGLSKLFIRRSRGRLFIKTYITRFKYISSNNLYINTDRNLKLFNFFIKRFVKLSSLNKIQLKKKKLYNLLFVNKSKLGFELNTLLQNNINVLNLKSFKNLNFINNNFLNKNKTIKYTFLKKYFNIKNPQLFVKEANSNILLYKQPLKYIIKNSIEKFTNTKVYLSIIEEPFILNSASTLCEFILNDLKGSRNSFRNILTSLFKDISTLNNVKGIRVNCSGRLSKTTTMAQTEWFRIGQIPLTTLSANVDYSHGTVKTKNGLCGVKVWIYYK